MQLRRARELISVSISTTMAKFFARLDAPKRSPEYLKGKAMEK
jgi:hypothetical protein